MAENTSDPLVIPEPVPATRHTAEPTAPPVEPAQPVEPASLVEPVETTPATQLVEPVETTPATSPVEPVETTPATPPVEPVETTPVAPADVPVATEVITPSSAPEVVALAATTPPVHEVIVVDAPVQPRRHGNRLAGIGLAVVGAIILTALLAGAVMLAAVVAGATVSVDFLTDPLFYAPVALFFLAMVLVVAIVNTAPWWSYIITSVVVGVIVYLGLAGIAVLEEGVMSLTQSEARDLFLRTLGEPFTIVAALLAREVAVWTGAILGRRGRGVRARNAEERAAYEREQAALVPTA